MARMNVVGTSPTKADALAKAVGDTLYGDDLRLPGEIYGRVVRAAITPARVKKIDPSRALALPGVHCVLTAKDIPGVNAGRYPDYPVLVEDVVRDIGDAIALVAAETQDLALEAARLVHVVYEPLPGAYDFTKPEGEIVCDWHTDKGDVDAAFARPDDPAVDLAGETEVVPVEGVPRSLGDGVRLGGGGSDDVHSGHAHLNSSK